MMALPSPGSASALAWADGAVSSASAKSFGSSVGPASGALGRTATRAAGSASKVRACAVSATLSWRTAGALDGVTEDGREMLPAATTATPAIR